MEKKVVILPFLSPRVGALVHDESIPQLPDFQWKSRVDNIISTLATVEDLTLSTPAAFINRLGITNSVPASGNPYIVRIIFRPSHTRQRRLFRSFFRYNTVFF